MRAASSHSAISARSEINDQPRRPTRGPRVGALTTCRMEELGIELRVVAKELRATDVNQHLRQLLSRLRFRSGPRRGNAGAVVGLDGCKLGVGFRPDEITDAVPGGIRGSEHGIALLDDGQERGDLLALRLLGLLT